MRKTKPKQCFSSFEWILKTLWNNGNCGDPTEALESTYGCLLQRSLVATPCYLFPGPLARSLARPLDAFLASQDDSLCLQTSSLALVQAGLWHSCGFVDLLFGFLAHPSPSRSYVSVVVVVVAKPLRQRRRDGRLFQVKPNSTL